MPCLWPRPERGRITAASPGSSSQIESPWEQLRGAWVQHQRRIDAGAQIETGGAGGGVGRQRKLTRRGAGRACGPSVGVMDARKFAARVAWRSARAHGRPRVRYSSRDQRDEIMRDHGLGTRPEITRPPFPQHHQRVVVLLEHLVVAHFVRGDQVEVLARELPRACCSTFVGLGGEADDERTLRGADTVARMSTVRSRPMSSVEDVFLILIRRDSPAGSRRPPRWR
jgi:hypothetical protein